MFRKIVLANDGSDQAFNALSLAVQIARRDHAELHMVSVEKRGQMPELVEEVVAGNVAAPARFDPIIRRARFLAEASQVAFHTHILVGNPPLEVVKLASDLGADLIVVGSCGHSDLYDRMIGNYARRILYHAQCSVLVIT